MSRTSQTTIESGDDIDRPPPAPRIARIVVVVDVVGDVGDAARWGRGLTATFGVPMVVATIDDVAAVAAADDLVVLGVSRSEGISRFAVGSHAHRLAHRLLCPLVLVPPDDKATADAPILVGVDGTIANLAVVEWARSVADQFGRQVEGVIARDPYYDTFDSAGDRGRAERVAHVAAEREDLVVHERRGQPAAVLAEIAGEIDPLITVIGVRGRYSLGGLLLGKVVDELIHRAPGPVAIVTHEAITRLEHAARHRVSDHAAAVAAQLHRVIVPTDVDDHALAVARATALELALRYGFEVMLYDRSDERWANSPHADGPLDIDQVEATGRTHLLAQMREFAEAGVPVTAFLAAVPSMTAIVDAVQQRGVDGVICPDRLTHPSVADRLQARHGGVAELVERVLELHAETRPVVLAVSGDGSVSVMPSI